MSNLMINKENELNTIDSREVAEMLGRSHSDLMKMIQGSGKNLGIIPVLTKGNFPLVDYFIESEYKDAKGENRKCYLVTKMGCEMLGNKLQGEKGILFSASYVKRFNDMEKQMTQTLLSFQIDDPIERAKAWIKEQEQAKLLLTQKDVIIEELSPLAGIARKRLDTTGTVSLTDVTKSFNLKRGQITVWGKDKGFIHKTIKEVNKAGENYFKIICTNGEHKGIAITEEGIKFIDKNLDEIKTYPCKSVKENT